MTRTRLQIEMLRERYADSGQYGVLTACNAYLDPNRAESSNLRLVMPTT